MTPDTPAEEEPPRILLPPLPIPPVPKPRRSPWVGCLLAVAATVLLLAGGATGGAWWWSWWSHRPVPMAPPLPSDIQDAEVRGSVERARQKVLDNPNDAYAWGYLGMTLEAHLYEADAARCFAEAARLDPTDAQWPYLCGMYALKADPD